MKTIKLHTAAGRSRIPQRPAKRRVVKPGLVMKLTKLKTPTLTDQMGHTTPKTLRASRRSDEARRLANTRALVEFLVPMLERIAARDGGKSPVAREARELLRRRPRY